ncbi:hypothetical protein ACIBF5_28480 [Micromonospora sp. NPDC050417]|uniref:hypothetical protein n=1 Tax=Micromonospora sp. NPDC050417 TaxID=3364280 RepID=UPI0037B776F7
MTSTWRRGRRRQAGVSATIDVSGVGFVAGMTFSIDGTECSVDGTWRLSMLDTVGGMGGSLGAFSLHFTKYEA